MFEVLDLGFLVACLGLAWVWLYSVGKAIRGGDVTKDGGGNDDGVGGVGRGCCGCTCEWWESCPWIAGANVNGHDEAEEGASAQIGAGGGLRQAGGEGGKGPGHE